MKSGRSKNDPFKAGHTTDNQRNRSEKKSGGKRVEKNGRRQSDILFSNIIERMTEGFVALDAQMNYTYVNQRGGELLKRIPEELIGKNHWEEYPQDKYTAFGRAYRRALETQTPIELEEYYAPRDRWFENRIYPSSEGLSIFFDDITERRQAQQSQRESEERFQTLANGSTVLLWVNGLEGCEFVNREYLDFLGVERTTDIRGYDWSSFVHPDDREAYMDSYLRAFNAQRPFRDEFRFRRRDGHYRWMRSEARPRRDANGTFLGFVGASVDITDQKQAEEALREKDKQLRRVTEVTPVLFSQCSRDLHYLFVNRAMAEFLGAPADEIIGRPMRELIGEDGFHSILPYIERVLNGEPVEYEMEIPYRVAGSRFMHLVYVPENDDAGNVTGWIETLTDITGRKQVENERSQLLASELTQRLNAEIARAEAEQAKAEAEQAKAEAERELAERKLAEAALGTWVDGPLPQDARPWWLRYGIALVATAVVVLLRVILEPFLGNSIQYSLLLGAITFSIWYGGIGPAFFSLVMGYLGIVSFVLNWEPIRAPTVANVASLVIFVFIGLTVMALGRAMNRAQHHAQLSARVSMERKRQTEARLKEQQRVEAALRESERKFSLIYHRLPFAAALSRPTDGVIVDVNQEFENIFGYTRQEVLGKTSLDLGINPAQTTRAITLEELQAKGSLHNVEVTVQTQTRGERVFLINLDIVEFEWQNYILQTAQDITDRKRAEVARSASSARLDLMAGISELIRKMEDPKELLYAVSTVVGEHLQVRRCLFNETDIENDLEIVHRDYYNGVESVAGEHKVSDYSSITSAEMQTGNTVVNFDSKTDERTAADYERTYGPRQERAYIAVPMMRENRWIATLWVSDDVPRQWSPEDVSLLETIAERTWAATEKLRIDSELRSSEARLRLATQAAQMFTWELDLQSQISKVGDNFAHALGFSSDQIPEENAEILQRFIHPEDGMVILQALSEAVQQRRDLRAIQYRIVHPETGNSIWLEVNGKITIDSSGTPTHMFGVGQNINERKQAEEDLRQLNLQLEGRVERRTAQLQAANQALEESQKRLQALSHRLVEVQEEERRAIARELHDRVGQSLSALNLNLTIINSQLSPLVNEQVNKRISESMDLVVEIITLVRDVMANLRPTVLDDFGLEAALQMYLKEFTARYLIGTQIEKIHSPLPPLGASIEMTLLRIIQECLLNVARHAQAERVALSLHLEENAVRLIVQDDGVGIQSGRSPDKPGGHGLVIMRERAEAVGGNLQISSEPGKGTQIQVRIPVQTHTLTDTSP